MMLSETLRMAGQSLWSHKARSLLTILGVVIGIGSVLAVVTLGKSFEASIVSEFDALDSRTVFVTITANDTGFQQGPPDAGNVGSVFTERDRQNLLALEHVEEAVPSAELPIAAFTYQGRTLPYRSVTATTPEADEVRDPDAYADGKVFVAGEAQIVLGNATARLIAGPDRDLQAGDSLILRLVTGEEVNVTVAGVLKRDDTLFGSANSIAMVPIDPFYDQRVASPITGQPTLVYGGLTLRADSSRNVDDVRDAVATYFEGPSSDAARLVPDGTRVLVATPSDITAAIGTAFDQVTLFIAAIAVVSLVVGAIGIANIMLVAVVERTREIGVMKAIGARNRDVLWLFLVEAIIVGLLGSALGLVIGLGGGAALVAGLFAEQGAPFVVPWAWLGIAVAVGVGVGAVAGYLPARRATRVQPVQALAHE